MAGVGTAAAACFRVSTFNDGSGDVPLRLAQGQVGAQAPPTVQELWDVGPIQKRAERKLRQQLGIEKTLLRVELNAAHNWDCILDIVMNKMYWLWTPSTMELYHDKMALARLTQPGSCTCCGRSLSSGEGALVLTAAEYEKHRRSRAEQKALLDDHMRKHHGVSLKAAISDMVPQFSSGSRTTETLDGERSRSRSRNRRE